MQPQNLLYAQSGGVTAVMNSTAAGVISTARANKDQISNVYCAQNGILGVFNEELIDTSYASDADIQALKNTPSGAFGSCRYKLKTLEEDRASAEKLIAVLKAHNIGYFLYNGGGDSQDTTHKIAKMAEALGYPLKCIGIPKTIDNDLACTDNCPGFGSVAKYVALSIREAAYDVSSMCASSTKVFVMEVMGRHAGWIAASAGLAQTHSDDAPQIILFPEVAFNEEKFLQAVDKSVKNHGYCAIVVSEGLKLPTGQFFSEADSKDAFGHTQLGGAAPKLAELIKQRLGHKYHYAILDYLQRAARHIASEVDVDQAFAMGEAAVNLALQNKTGVMPIIVRESDAPYQWRIGEAKLDEVANIEKTLPKDFISPDGFSITEKARRYLRPLIQGEAYPDYKDGLPNYFKFERHFVAKKYHTEVCA